MDIVKHQPGEYKSLFDKQVGRAYNVLCTMGSFSQL